MPNFTMNYELHKPLPTEYYDVEVQNENLDRIDWELGETQQRILAHTQGDGGHVTREEREKWNELALKMADWDELKPQLLDALTKINEHEIRIKLLEDSLFSNITGNPFTVTFAGLGDIKLIEGVWNKEKSWIEC